jgi:hypothetical protein
VKLIFNIAETPALADIREVITDRSLPRAARIAEFVRQIRNPRRYLCGDFTITAEFAKDGPSIEKCLQGLMA